MTLWFIGGVLCMMAGLGLMGATFYVQKQEDKTRVAGYYTTGTIVSNKAVSMGERDVTFEFTKDFKVWHCTSRYPATEAANWKVGRRSLIVYDDRADAVYFNPMQASRKKQAWMLLVGGVLLLTGMYWSVAVCGMLGM